ncbi:MAG: 6-phosphofructokinase [Clostridiales bacterium]|nr:6-phosphofructokinase [Clostridiales bacterium]
MKRIAILTSGGDSPGMNAAVRAVVRSAIFEGMTVFGVERGYDGLMEGDIHEIDVAWVGDILHRGGTKLRTARSEKFRTPEGQDEAVATLKKHEIDALVVIGGDGSFKGAYELAKRGIMVVGIPGTIDNDMAYTDYTIGFDTAINTVTSIIGNIRDTSSSHERTTVIEVMGRNCGDIAMQAGLAGGAEFVLIPEVEANLDELCEKILNGRERGKLHSIIINAEGSGIKTQELADIIEEKTGLDTKIVVPGYIQRGGTPTAKERIVASRMGKMAVDLIKEGAPSSAVGTREGKVFSCSIEEAVNTKRTVDLSVLELVNIMSI